MALLAGLSGVGNIARLQRKNRQELLVNEESPSLLEVLNKPCEELTEIDRKRIRQLAGYHSSQIAWLYGLYAIAIICWIVIIIYFELHFNATLVTWIIILIPIALFIIALVNIKNITADTEVEIFNANYLTIGLLIAIPLFSWISAGSGDDRRRFSSIIVLAIIFSMLSVLDTWVSLRWLTFVKHAKSVLQTYCLILFVTALITFYHSMPEGTTFGMPKNPIH